jgi:hypothetical protein
MAKFPHESSESSSVDATAPILPVVGIYTIAPPRNYFSTENEKNKFYNTSGLDGVFITLNWINLESSQGVYQPFDSIPDLYNTLSDIISANGSRTILGLPPLQFALAIVAGPSQSPPYLVTSPIDFGGTYRVPNAEIPGAQTGGSTVYSPFPFDPGFIYCYQNLWSAILTDLASTTISSVLPISLLTSIKIGLYTGDDSEIQIDSWNGSATGTARSDAPQWLLAFTTPGFLASSPTGTGSSWPGYAASAWQTTVISAWTSHLEWLQGELNTLATDNDLPNLANVTFSCPLFIPKISFPLIDANGNIIPCPDNDSLPDNSGFVRLLLGDGAAAVDNPIQAIDTSLSIAPSPGVSPVDYPLIYDNTSVDLLIHGPASETYLAFQTNDFGGNGTAAGTQSDPIALSNQVTKSCNTYRYILEDGLQVPNQSSAPPYTEPYSYEPYIEIHYQDVLIWNGTTSSVNATACVLGNVIELVHEDIFGS